ncbi:MAG: transglutaminase domain-containing protein, partial [Candidatus Aenigmarchaeota archaeon]|nr:transglutaminase domain-containing protein [Candidatus Aenigmarchaeota archaeon]
MILAPLAFAEQDIEDPSQITILDSKVVQSGGVAVSGQSIQWVKLNITLPQNKEYQTTSNKADYALDEYENSIMVYEEEKPSNAVYYSLESIVQTKSRRTHTLPGSYTVPENVRKYINPSANIQSDNERIIQHAKKISENKNSDFEKIAALASYVHNNTEYIESFGTSSKDALWVFENKVGTCDEYSSLFIALARALGYPARYITGYAYGDKGWTPHAWAEVYLGVWVPVDATWLEVGWLDGTHIEFHASGTNRVENTAEIYGVSAKIDKWLPGETTIETQDYTLQEKDSGYSLLQTADVLEPGETSIVVLKIIPSEYAVLEVSLVPCKSEKPIVSIENRERETVLVPGEETILWWHVTAENNLQKNIIYTCPLVLNSRLLGVRKVNITVDTSGQDETSVNLFAELQSPILSAGDAQTVFATAERVKGLEGHVIGFVSKDGYTEKEVSESSTSAEFSFTPKNTGI